MSIGLMEAAPYRCAHSLRTSVEVGNSPSIQSKMSYLPAATGTVKESGTRSRPPV